MTDLGDQNLRLAEQGRKPIRDALDKIEQELDGELRAEVLSDKTGELAVDVNLPKRWTVTGFAQATWKQTKDLVWGARVTKKFLWIVFVLVSAPAFAQVPAQPGQLFKWNQPTTEEASIARFEMKIDAGAFVDVGKTLSNDTATPTGFQSYSRVIPALTPGNHTFVVRACPATGSCGPESNPFAFAIIVISQPTGLRIGSGS